jgi:hypothetical protein
MYNAVQNIDLVLIDQQSVGKRSVYLMDTVNAKKRWTIIYSRVNKYLKESHKVTITINYSLGVIKAMRKRGHFFYRFGTLLQATKLLCPVAVTAHWYRHDTLSMGTKLCLVALIGHSEIAISSMCVTCDCHRTRTPFVNCLFVQLSTIVRKSCCGPGPTYDV